VTTSIGKKQSISPHEKRLALLSRCLQAIREAKKAEDMFQAALEYIQQEFPYPLIWLCRYDRSQHLIQGAGGYVHGKPMPFLQEALVLASGEILEQLVLQMRPMVVPDLKAEQRGGRLSQVAKKLAIQGALLFPFRHQDFCHGLVILGSERWGMLAKTDEKAMLSIIAGELGVSLHRLMEQCAMPLSPSGEHPLATVIAKIHQAATLEQRLEIAAEEAQDYLNANRIAVYWFEPDGRYFCQRTVAVQKGQRKTISLQTGEEFRLSAKQCPGVYQTLSKNTIVEITPTQSSLALDATTRILELLRVKALLGAPLWLENRLFGFVAAEETKSRVWQAEEVEYLKTLAQVLSISCGLERVDQEKQRIRANNTLLDHISQVIRTEQDWHLALKTTAERLAEHFGVERMLLLSYDAQIHQFSIVFQHQTGRLKEIHHRFPGLSEVDWRMLQERADPIAVEDLEEDLRFLYWRDIFQDHGVQSLVVCRTTAHLPLEGVLLITHEQPRSWHSRDLDLFQTVVHQLGVLLHQWQLQQDIDQQKSLYQTLQWGLTTIQQIDEQERLEQLVTQFISQLLHTPLALLVTWQPRRPVGRIAALSVSNPQFELCKTDIKISLQDVFLQQILATDGILHLTVDQLLPDTLQWLNSSAIEQVMGLALRTNPEDDPLGVMIVAAAADHFWSERTLSLFGIFVNQLAWFRRSLLKVDRLKASQLQLRQLNWYKQFRVIELKRSLELAANSLNALTNGQKSPNITPKVYYQQALGQVTHVMNTMMQILRQEQWQLQLTKQTVSLASFLKRSLERIDPLVRQRHLWLQVHAENTTLDLMGDIPKLEGIFYQLLLFSCSRCSEQGRIDIWSRLLDEKTLDLSITDNGTIEPRLLAELQEGPPRDALMPSALEQQPGMTLFICQTILTTLGGSVEFYHLEDGRVMSRMVLPFIVQ
jgi:GAF domain-containing protein